MNLGVHNLHVATQRIFVDTQQQHVDIQRISMGAQAKHVTVHANIWVPTKPRGCPISSCGHPAKTPDSPQYSTWTPNSALPWTSTQKCGHPICRVAFHETLWAPKDLVGVRKTSWTPNQYRGSPPQMVWQSSRVHPPKAWSSTARLWRSTKRQHVASR